MLCPFHQETDPSLQLYPDGSFYCFGAGCGKGGTIFDFAAASWGMGTHRLEFLELRRRLASAFAITPPSWRTKRAGGPRRSALGTEVNGDSVKNGATVKRDGV